MIRLPSSMIDAVIQREMQELSRRDRANRRTDRDASGDLLALLKPQSDY